jgi:superkiller protein 3
MTACALAVVIALAGSAVWFGQWKATRRAETDRAVTAALTQAETLVAEGDKQIDHPERWQAAAQLALAAQEKAEELFAAGEGSDELAGRARQVRAAVDEALTDSRLLVELDRIRLEAAAVVKEGNYDVAWAASQYAKALADYGIDVAAPETAAARVRGSRLREALVAALAVWMRVTKDTEERQRVQKVYQLVLPVDSLRPRLMAAVRRRDGAELVKLEKEPAFQDLPPATLVILAKDLAVVKEWAAAERLLRAGLERKPGDFWLNHDLGILLVDQEPPRAEEAVLYLAVAMALRSDSPAAHNNLGFALRKKGDLEGAIRRYRAVLKLDPLAAYAHANLGVALAEQNKLDEAILPYKEAIRLKPNFAEAHYNLGNALKAKGLLSEAIDAYKTAIHIKPEYAEAYGNLGQALYEQKKLDEAVKALRQAIHLRPNDHKGYTNLGIALKSQGKLAEAEMEYRKAIRLEPNDYQTRTNLGMLLTKRGQFAKAEEQFRQAIKDKADYGNARRELAFVLAKQNKFREAVAACQEATRLNPKDQIAYCNLGDYLRKLSKFAEAEGALLEAIKIKPDFPAAHYNLALVFHQQGKLVAAEAEYRKTLDLDPQDAEAHCNLGLVLMKQGKFAAALPELRRGHELGSRRAHWHYPSADWLRAAERLAELDAKLPKILEGEVAPANASESAQLGWLFQQPYKQLNAASARFYAAAFEAEPKLAEDPHTGNRYEAARAAALAGCGQGKDAAKPDERERTRLRQQARTWLRADLAAWRKLLAGDYAKVRPVVRQTMQHWLANTDFAGLRDPTPLAKLPEAERHDWQTLWADVQELFARAGEKSSWQEK